MIRRLIYISVAVVLCASFFLPARADAPVQDAKAAMLLAKHRAYVGWQLGDGTFSSMRISGSVTDDKGKKTERFVMLSKGIVYNHTYTLLDSAGAIVHTGYTGNLFWQADVNGFPAPIYGDYAKISWPRSPCSSRKGRLSYLQRSSETRPSTERQLGSFG